MYIFPEMINMGLNKGQDWPSPEHKQVASALGLENSYVTTRDTLTEIVQSVLRVPADRIKLVTADDLATEFRCPVVW